MFCAESSMNQATIHIIHTNVSLNQIHLSIVSYQHFYTRHQFLSNHPWQRMIIFMEAYSNYVVREHYGSMKLTVFLPTHNEHVEDRLSTACRRNTFRGSAHCYHHAVPNHKLHQHSKGADNLVIYTDNNKSKFKSVIHKYSTAC
jgi:hypothetical protein